MTGERRTMWHKFVPIAMLNYNTSHHSSLGCEPRRVFHGRIPYNVLDIKFGIKASERFLPKTEMGGEILQKTKQIYEATQKSLMQSYIKNKKYYDKKANAHPLNNGDYCFALHPRAATQSTKVPFRDYMWTGPYIVEKVLPNNNYIVRRLETNRTQIFHRIRLRIYKTTRTLPDIVVSNDHSNPIKK